MTVIASLVWGSGGGHIAFTPTRVAKIFEKSTSGVAGELRQGRAERSVAGWRLSAKLSPNGKWLAQTFPTPGRKWQVSTNGGNRPVWSRDGKEFFYIGPDQKLRAVEVKAEGQFGVSWPLFTTRLPTGGSQFDVSKDGRFLIPTESEQSARVPMTAVVNWAAGLK